MKECDPPTNFVEVTVPNSISNTTLEIRRESNRRRHNAAGTDQPVFGALPGRLQLPRISAAHPQAASGGWDR